MSEKDKKKILSGPQGVRFIAELFGCTTRRVEQLKTEGIIEGGGKPTKYDAYENCKSIYRLFNG